MAADSMVSVLMVSVLIISDFIVSLDERVRVDVGVHSADLIEVAIVLVLPFLCGQLLYIGIAYT